MDAPPGIGHNQPPVTIAEALREIAGKLASFRHDPLGFVLWAYPWGVPGTTLEIEEGPDEWQREELDEIGRRLRKDPHKPIRRATASGHGIGKSAMVSWLIHWAAMTKHNAKGVVTANTDTQLRTKTWAELAKWHSLLALAHPLLADRWKYTATSLHIVGSADQEKEWRIDAIPWSKANPAAFQGLHNAGKRVLLLFDEASEIDDMIWDVAMGALTDAGTEIVFCAYANPTKPTGRFKENAVGRFRQLWDFTSIDSRTVRRTNKAEIQAWVDAWGLDSDFVRIRVTGQFPRVGSMQLIASDVVAAARTRPALYIPSDPLVVGLDVARYGDDASVLQPRRGRDARTLPRKEWRGVDLMQLAAEVAEWDKVHKADAYFVDISGLGVGVYDRLMQLKVPNVYGVNFGGGGWETSFNGVSVRTANMRAFMWTSMREWLKLGAIADDPRVEEDLTGVQYGFNADQAILLEPKEAMKKRGLSSPDIGDALGLTFAMTISPRGIDGTSLTGQSGVTTEYDVFKELL